MSVVCDRCGKRRQVGYSVSHSHRKTKRRFYPNLHSVRVFIGSGRARMKLCTKCLRIVREEEKKRLSAIKKPKVTVEASADQLITNPK